MTEWEIFIGIFVALGGYQLGEIIRWSYDKLQGKCPA